MARARRFVKICGVTRLEDASFVVDAGADAIGVNLIPTSARRVDIAGARNITEAFSTRVLVIAVVADLSISEMQELRRSTGIEWLQLHGGEPNDVLQQLLPFAFKAVRVGDAADAARAAAFSGDHLLADAKVKGQLGGTGATFDWTLVRSLSRERKLILAGGLTPENVGEAIRTADPWGVDVASGVEVRPGVKDETKVRAFIDAARAADSA